MRKIVLTLAALFGFSAPGYAQVETLVTVNGWRAYSATAASGRQLCGMGTSARRTGRFFWIKAQRLSGSIVGFVQIGDRAWSVPREARGRIVVAIDRRRAELRYTGTRRPTMIEASYRGAYNNFLGFVRAFALGNRMEITFPNGSIRPWGANLGGTERVTRAFLECTARL